MNNKTKHILLFSSILLLIGLIITGFCAAPILTVKILACLLGIIVAIVIIAYIWFGTETMIYGYPTESNKIETENNEK